MTHVAYHKESTRLLCNCLNGVYVHDYKTEAAAKAAITRACNRTMKADVNDYAVAEIEHFYKRIEKKETVRNLMSGKPVVQSVNTPRCCDPSSELYWSM
jgi:hypothetical protein